ncbi:hypothetical protein [Palleronia caenipelagi]|uniref:hypothetical protein n=1 Tax=Palleronia caenipelagi TaxID=2489174 RepID=UPI00115CF055|nr:hypothetical protein [Palleronia caenipelagi]
MIALLATGIALVLGLKARQSLRHDPGPTRGQLPGDGVTVLRAEYQSGMGGGEETEYTIPKDPQAYARLFVPKEKRTDRR